MQVLTPQVWETLATVTPIVLFQQTIAGASSRAFQSSLAINPKHRYAHSVWRNICYSWQTKHHCNIILCKLDLTTTKRTTFKVHYWISKRRGADPFQHCLVFSSRHNACYACSWLASNLQKHSLLASCCLPNCFRTITGKQSYFGDQKTSLLTFLPSKSPVVSFIKAFCFTSRLLCRTQPSRGAARCLAPQQNRFLRFSLLSFLLLFTLTLLSQHCWQPHLQQAEPSSSIHTSIQQQLNLISSAYTEILNAKSLSSYHKGPLLTVMMRQEDLQSTAYIIKQN